MTVALSAAAASIIHTTIDVAQGGTDFTFACWFNKSTTGVVAQNVLFGLSEIGANFRVRFVTSTENISILANGWTTDGDWRLSAVNNTWHALAVSYDWATAINDPVVRLDFVSRTTSEFGTPAGTFTAPPTGAVFGNVSAGSQQFDGKLAYAQVWNRALSAAEMDLALRRPGAVRSGLRIFLPLFTAENFQPNLADGTNRFTATVGVTVSGPPVVPFWFGDDDDDEVVAAALFSIQRVRRLIGVGR